MSPFPSDFDPPLQPAGPTAYVCDRRFLEHDTGPGHPERADRLRAIDREMTIRELVDRVVPIEPRAAEEALLRNCHSVEYLQTAKRDIQEGRRQLSTGDTKVCSASWEIARLSAGAALSAVDAVVSGEARNAFCAVRPPGHHATAERGMGFCIFNNIAVAARYAQEHHGLGRIMIVDWDVHHGNGTQDLFYDDDSVLFFSVHQSPWYPGSGDAEETGTGTGLGMTKNVPLPSGAGRDEIMDVFHNILLPLADRVQPEMIFVSAGFDSRRNDPLGEFLLDDEDFADMTRLLKECASTHSENRLVSLLEGGYSLEGVANATCAHIEALLE